MEHETCIKDWMETIAKILIRSFILGYVLLLIWVGFYLFGSEICFRITTKIFAITRSQFDLMNYYGIVFVKVCVFLFFLIPYISIRLVLAKH